MGSRVQRFSFIAAVAALLCVAACRVDTPSLDQIRDSKLLDRRIHETPRQKVVRECQQETDRFRVECTFCHQTDKIDAITTADPKFTKTGVRAQIMRKSPSFGLNQDCEHCHQSKFKLNRSAEKSFGPGGQKHQDAQKELTK
ncbi:MAG TPA: hypothetical protein VGP72_13835 [Planctomycetota bacterium]|jgi:hypothetical protein